jgi:hypothetical protein
MADDDRGGTTRRHHRGQTAWQVPRSLFDGRCAALPRSWISVSTTAVRGLLHPGDRHAAVQPRGEVSNNLGSLKMLGGVSGGWQ